MKYTLTLLISFLIICPLTAQDIKGTLVLKFGESIEGNISQLNLTGENKGLVYIENSSTSQSKKKNEKTSMTITEKKGFNPVIISRVIIDGTSYLFRDLRYGYDDNKIWENCLVQRYFGNDSLSIYQWKNAEGETRYYVSTPRFTEYGEDISHPKYNNDAFGYMVALKFSRCESLAKKIYDRVPGYTYNNSLASAEVKLAVWKKIMEEYMACF